MKKKFKLSIERRCPKCGKKTVYNLVNAKELSKNPTLNKIYMCSVCGNKL